MMNRPILKYSTMETPVGPLMIAGEEDCLRYISFSTGKGAITPSTEWEEASCGVVRETMCQLQAYFDKKLIQFDLPVQPEGTPFQLEVWGELQKIPYGTVISYGELARRVGRPKASRAVGSANGSNPIPIVIPCHRVIGCNGSMTGYGGGVPIKASLLNLEGSISAVQMRL